VIVAKVYFPAGRNCG